MTEPVEAASGALVQDYGDYIDDYELPTNRLHGSSVDRVDIAPVPTPEDEAEAHGGDRQPAIDCLAKLTTQADVTLELADEPPQREPKPSGMREHDTAPLMVPTVRARLTTGLRRGTLLVVLSVLVGAALAVGGYLLASTSWLSTLVASAPSSPSSPASEQAQPASSR